MISLACERTAGINHPIDIIEDFASFQKWKSVRLSETELNLSVPGRLSSYRLVCLWDEEFAALQLCCQTDIRIQDVFKASMADLLLEVNQRMWLGHFDLCQQTMIPQYRYTALLRDMHTGADPDEISDIIDVALSECERFYPAFKLMADGDGMAFEMLSSTVLDSAGEA